MRQRNRFSGTKLLILGTLLLFACSSVLAKESIPLGKMEHLFDLDKGPDGPLSLPSDVAIAKDNRIYVVDGGHHRVLAYGPEGDYLFTIGKRGRANGEFMGPLGIEVDSTGLIYVADKDNHRVQVFDRNGKHKFSFDIKGKMAYQDALLM